MQAALLLKPLAVFVSRINILSFYRNKRVLVSWQVLGQSLSYETFLGLAVSLMNWTWAGDPLSRTTFIGEWDYATTRSDLKVSCLQSLPADNNFDSFLYSRLLDM